MKATEIKARLEKAQEAVTKKQDTLEKHMKKATKIRAQIAAAGWDENKGRYQKEGTAEHHDCYWTMCDLDDALESIRNTEKAIAEKEAIVKRYEKQLAEALEKEDTINRLFPDVLREFQGKVVDMWDRWDVDRQKRLREEYESMRAADTSRLKMDAYNAFIKKYTYKNYEFAMHATFEEIHRDNEKAAERVVMNLWNRVKEIVGDVTECHLHLTQGNEWEGVTVNGTVKGTKGTATVETIGAGGWNIQKFHYRTLVHEWRQGA